MLDKSVTDKLRRLHTDFLKRKNEVAKAQLAAESARLELLSEKERVLLEHDGWGKEFNSDYTEIVDAKKD